MRLIEKEKEEKNKYRKQKKSTKPKPDFAVAYNNLRNAYYEKCNYNKAIECCEKVIELKPDIAEAYYNMGNTYDAKKIMIKQSNTTKKPLN